jgi:4'-phosphopantetheinyl transferase EntD
MIQLDNPYIFSFFTAEHIGSDAIRPEERVFTEGFATDRMMTFCAGRFCARRAMQLMGYPGVAIPIGKDRAPVWPAGMAGSISHTQGLVGAMVCSTGDHPSIGLDIERRNAVDRSLWDILFDEVELKQILATPSPDEQATLFFSLKEAYYKMQYPLTGKFLDFRDVRVEDGPAGIWINRLKPLSEAAPAHHTGHLLTPEFVVTWVLAE